MAKNYREDLMCSDEYRRLVKNERKAEIRRNVLILALCIFLSSAGAKHFISDIRFKMIANKSTKVENEDNKTEFLDTIQGFFKSFNKTQNEVVISEIADTGEVIEDIDLEQTDSIKDDYDDYLNLVNGLNAENQMNIDETIKEVEIPPYNSLIDDSKGTFFVDNQIEVPEINFKELKENVNNDIIGWINIPGYTSKKDYVSPNYVMQNAEYQTTAVEEKQNKDFYLHHDKDGSYNGNGTVYQDSRNNSLDNEFKDISDINVLYGHSISTRFKRLRFLSEKNYSVNNPDILENPPYGIFQTASGELYKMNMLSVNVVDGDNVKNVYTKDFESLEEYQEHLQYILDTSDYYIEQNVSYEKPMKIIATSTCSYEKRYPVLPDGSSNDRTVIYWVLEPQLRYTLEKDNNKVKTLK